MLKHVVEHNKTVYMQTFLRDEIHLHVGFKGVSNKHNSGTLLHLLMSVTDWRRKRSTASIECVCVSDYTELVKWQGKRSICFKGCFRQANIAIIRQLYF